MIETGLRAAEYPPAFAAAWYRTPPYLEHDGRPERLGSWLHEREVRLEHLRELVDDGDDALRRRAAAMLEQHRLRCDADQAWHLGFLDGRTAATQYVRGAARRLLVPRRPDMAFTAGYVSGLRSGARQPVAGDARDELLASATGQLSTLLGHVGADPDQVEVSWCSACDTPRAGLHSPIAAWWPRFCCSCWDGTALVEDETGAPRWVQARAGDVCDHTGEGA